MRNLRYGFLAASHALNGDVTTAKLYGARLGVIYPNVTAREMVGMHPDRNPEANERILPRPASGWPKLRGYYDIIAFLRCWQAWARRYFYPNRSTACLLRVA